jgi:hypothetical protein
LFDSARYEWSLYWANSHDGILQRPVIGRFKGGRGEFFGSDTYGALNPGSLYLVGATPTSARWEQAFSTDAGQS